MRKRIKTRILFQRPEPKEFAWVKAIIGDNAQTNPMIALLLLTDVSKAVCLYTEKYDKDGKEIYEDDIMRGDNGISYVVEYNPDLAMFTLSELVNDSTCVRGTTPLGEILKKDPSLRVVGNTYGVSDSEVNAKQLKHTQTK